MSQEHKLALTFEGAERIDIVCREDEDVVTAAFRQGYLLLTECREGSCATCRGFLVDGDYDELLPHSPHALSDHEEDDGYILACRLQPRSDLEIDFDYPLDRVGRYDEQTRSGQVVSADRLSTGVARIVVRTNASQDPLRWEAGQYVQVTIPAIGATRSYSMANLSDGGRELELLIRLLPGGRFSGHVAAGLATGEPVRLRGPFGNFTFRGDRRPVFVAGGTGIAPILAMLRSLARTEPAVEARLVFGVATEEDLVVTDLLAELGSALPNLDVVPTVEWPGPSWTGAVGVVTDHLGVPDPDSAYYLCGPPAMTTAVEAHLAGVPPRPHPHRTVRRDRRSAVMTRNRKAVAAGAAPRTEYPPYGDQDLRREWTERLAGVADLDTAVDLLLGWRRGSARGALEEADALWIEARIEDRVAVRRFEELSGDCIDTTTLTGESIADACEAAVHAARTATDVPALEAAVASFRRTYKPPVMPTVPFLRTETELAELLILRRSKSWFDEPLAELRRRRSAVLISDAADPAALTATRP
ncbi:FAD-binding oxidoreductase [Mycolicibacterium sp. XJ1819]